MRSLLPFAAVVDDPKTSAMTSTTAPSACATCASIAEPVACLRVCVNFGFPKVEGLLLSKAFWHDHGSLLETKPLDKDDSSGVPHKADMTGKSLSPSCLHANSDFL